MDKHSWMPAGWPLTAQPSVNTAATVGQVMKGCHMCRTQCLVPRLLSNYLSVCGIHIIASSFWPCVHCGYFGSSLIDCTSEGNKSALDLVKRQGQM